MTENTKGIIIRIKDYKDNALLLDVLCDKYGLVSFVAKGARKPMAKLHFFVSTLYEITFDYKEGKTIFSLINAKSIKTYIKYDNAILNSFVSIFYEILYRSKEICDIRTYNNLFFFLENINGDNYYLLGSIFMAYLMKLHGIEPYVDGCVKCNSKKVIAINNDLGGFVCKNCSVGNTYPIELLKNFRIISKASFANYDAIKDIKVDNDLFKCMCDFFIYNSDVKLKSYDFFERLI